MDRRNWTLAKEHQHEMRQWAEHERLANSPSEGRRNSSVARPIWLLVVTVLALGITLFMVSQYTNSMATDLAVQGTSLQAVSTQLSVQGIGQSELNRLKLIRRNESNHLEREAPFVVHSRLVAEDPSSHHLSTGIVRR